MISKEKYLRKIKNSQYYQYADDKEEILADAERIWERRYEKNKQHSKFERKLKSPITYVKLHKAKNLDDLDI